MKQKLLVTFSGLTLLAVVLLALAPKPTKASCHDGVWHSGFEICAAGPPTDCTHCIVR